MSLFKNYHRGKHCFIYCGDDKCNCDIAYRRDHFLDDALLDIDKIAVQQKFYNQHGHMPSSKELELLLEELKTSQK